MPEARPQPAPEADLILPRGRMEEFLEQNFKKILIGTGLLAVVLLTVAVMRHFSHQTAAEAAERFTSASTVEDCDVVILKYPGTVAAGNALLLKARLQWGEGKKESSIATLQEFLKSQSRHPLQAEALFGLGSKQAVMGDKESARQSFATLQKSYPESELLPGSEILLADLLWAEGKTEEARKLLEGLPSKYPGKMTAFVSQAEERVKMLNAGLPQNELDPPPAPAPAPSTTPVVPNLEVPSLLTPPGVPGLPMAPLSPSGLTPPAGLDPLTPVPSVPLPAPVPAPAPAPEAPPTPAPAAEAPAPSAAAPAPAPAAPAPAPEAPKP